jgi:hypothetical protein
MADEVIKQAGDFNFQQRDTLLRFAEWRPRPLAGPGLPLIAPIPPTGAAARGVLITIQQYVAQHESILDGQPVHFGDLINIGPARFVQFRIKPTTVPLALHCMTAHEEHLKESFQILVATGSVVAMMRPPANKPGAGGPKLEANFKD